MNHQTVLSSVEGRQAIRGHHVIVVLGSSLMLAAVAGGAFIAAFHFGAF